MKTCNSESMLSSSLQAHTCTHTCVLTLLHSLPLKSKSLAFIGSHPQKRNTLMLMPIFETQFKSQYCQTFSLNFLLFFIPCCCFRFTRFYCFYTRNTHRNGTHTRIVSCPLTVNMALVYDGVQLLAETFKHVQFRPEALNCNDDSSWDKGYTLVNYMKSVSGGGTCGGDNEMSLFSSIKHFPFNFHVVAFFLFKVKH